MKRSLACAAVILSLIASMGQQARAGDVASIITEIRYLIDDVSTDVAKQTYSDTALLARVNLAQTDVCMKTMILTDNLYVAMSSGVWNVNIPTMTVMVNGVAIRYSSYVAGTSTITVYKSLERVTRQGLELQFPTWMTATASLPTKYFTSNGQIWVYPPPSVQYSSICVYAAVKGNALTTSSTPYNGRNDLEQFHDLLVYYVVAKCREDEGDYNAATYWYNKYVTLVGYATAYAASKPDWAPSFVYSPTK